MPNIRKILILLLSFIFTVQISSVSYAGLTCSASPSTFMTILAESIATLYNVFPITIAGVPIKLYDLPTTDTIGGSPICVCVTGAPPIPHIGLTFGWWNPQAVIETTKTPFCMISLGFSLGGGKYFGYGKANSEHPQTSTRSPNAESSTFENLHYVKYPTFGVLELFTDVTCLTFQGIDIFYMTEFDPTWRDDELSAILTPESILFANPIAQLMCIPDSIASTLGFPLDPLFWCMGSWGSVYPMAGEKHGPQVQASAGLAARGIYKMARQLMLWQTVGRDVLCGPIPMPIWIKSQYSIYEAYPKLWPNRMPIGRAGTVWTAGANTPIPGKADNFAWFLYQHHHCCLF